MHRTCELRRVPHTALVTKPVHQGVAIGLSDFNCTANRATYGDYFGIGVAGYPEAHPDAICEDPAQNEANYKKDLAYLKEKVCPHAQHGEREREREREREPEVF